MNIQVEVGKSYKDNKGNVWECVLNCEDIDEAEAEAEKYLEKRFPNYKANNFDYGYHVAFSNTYRFVLVNNVMKIYDTCQQDGTIWSTIMLVEEVVVPFKEVPKKFFIMHKHSKMFYCIDERGNICLYDENENRFSLGNTDKILAKDYIKLDITFDEYLELTGLKRKDNLKDSRNNLIESFGCQKVYLTPVLNKFEELLSEISKAKRQEGSLESIEADVIDVLLYVFQNKKSKLLFKAGSRDGTKKLLLEYIELFDKQLTKTAN